MTRWAWAQRWAAGLRGRRRFDQAGAQLARWDHWEAGHGNRPEARRKRLQIGRMMDELEHRSSTKGARR